MSENNKKINSEETADNTIEKKKKRFRLESPYAEYAADNDMISEQMDNMAEEEDIKPDARALLRSALTAAGLVAIFALCALVVGTIGNCITG